MFGAEFGWLLGWTGKIRADVIAPIGFVLAAVVTAHVLLRKREIGSAIGWIGLAWLSPIIGCAIYFVFGINRVARRARRVRRGRHARAARYQPPEGEIAEHLKSLECAARRITQPQRRRRQQRANVRQWRRGLSRHAGSDRRGARKRGFVELHLPRRRGRAAVHRGAAGGEAARRRDAGAIDGIGSGYFYSGCLSAVCKRAGMSRRPLHALAAAVADAVPQFAHAQEDAGHRRARRFHRRDEHRAPRTW